VQGKNIAQSLPLFEHNCGAHTHTRIKDLRQILQPSDPSVSLYNQGVNFFEPFSNPSGKIKVVCNQLLNLSAQNRTTWR
jgi:hypothetical protein